MWTEKTELFGSNFHDRYIVAEFTIEVICLFALIVIAIWSVTFKKRSEPSRAIFRWFRFGIALLMGLVYDKTHFTDIAYFLFLLTDLIPGPSVLALSA